MRIAFTSCFCTQVFKQQPVWDEIAAENPDVLVLLGDSIYLDVGGQYNSLGVQNLSEMEFAQHAHDRYKELLAQKQFRALVQRPSLTTYAIWDDHDFLWNDACGADAMKSPVQRPLIYPSRAVFAAYRQALSRRLAARSFPATPPPWDANTPPPGYSMVALGANVFLHLTDGRSYRKGRGKKAMLGMEQLDAMQAQMAAAPVGATHLVASGSVFDANSGESWLNCVPEYERMQGLAKVHNILILSGDIHDNNLASYALDGGRNLFEATASGAAVKTAVVFGALQRNFGMLNIDDSKVEIRLSKSGATQYSGAIDRVAWK